MADFTPSELFRDLPKRFNPVAAKGMDAAIQFDLTGEDAGQWHAIIRDGTLEVNEGAHTSPNMTMTMRAKDYVDLNLGKLSGQMAFMRGKIKIAGDMGLAMKLQIVFRYG